MPNQKIGLPNGTSITVPGIGDFSRYENGDWHRDGYAPIYRGEWALMLDRIATLERAIVTADYSLIGYVLSCVVGYNGDAPSGPLPSLEDAEAAHDAFTELRSAVLCAPQEEQNER